MRVPRDAKLETREGRLSIATSGDVRWRNLGKGLALGYRRGRWWVRERTNGRYTKKSIGEADDHGDADGHKILSYRDACRIAYGGKEAHDAAREGAYTVGTAMDDYMRWYRAHRKAAHNTQVTIERHILPAFEHKAIDKLTAREIRSWHEKIADTPAAARSSKTGPKRFVPIDEDVDADERKRRRKSTANRVLTILKAALSHAFRESHVDSDIEWRRVKPFEDVDAPRIRYLDAAEARRLINGCDGEFRPLVRAALVTGCRYGEILALQVDDYNHDAGNVRVRASKGGKRRDVPLTTEGVELFEAATAGRPGRVRIFTRADGSPWATSHQVRRMKAASTAAKLKPTVRFHELRHTYASVLAQKGVPLHVIAEVLGHADTRMTKRHYAHLAPSYVADTVRANLPRFSRKRPSVKRAG